jgi:toxin ParE1/3/4
MKKVLIAGAAQRDLSEIAAYTEANWGSEQKRRYLDAIRDRIRELRDNPEIGVKRNDVRPGYRSLASGQHQIFYRTSDTVIVVLRVLHGSMDVHRHIGEAQDRAFESLSRPRGRGKGRG